MYKIIVDSCGELTEEQKKSGYFETGKKSMYLIPDQLLSVRQLSE